jgi:site-specific DNA-methyltransferase (adenine-specific)
MDVVRETRAAAAAVVGGEGLFFETAGVQIHQGDSLRLLQSLRRGAMAGVITDPPYCSGGMTTAERSGLNPVAKYCHNRNAVGRPTFDGDNRDQRSFAWWCTAWLAMCRDATVRGGRLLVFVDWRQLPTMTDAVQAAGWTWRGIQPWDKGRRSRAPHTGYHRHQCEYLVFATNGPCLKRTGGPFDGCWRHSVNRKEKRHITGKPVELLRELVRTVDPAGPILDPFAGSCSLGVASLLEGRTCILMEESPDYCAIGADWLRSTAAAGSVPAGAA